MINNIFSPKIDRHKFILLGIISGIALIHINLTGKLANNSDQELFVFIFWTGLLFLIYKRKNFLKLNTDIFSLIIGIILIIFTLYKSISIYWYEAYFLSLYPLISGLGIALIASGFKHLKQYWREFILIIFICFPGSYWENELIEKYFYVSELTARFTNFALWNFGFNVVRQGVIILYNNGGVLVNYSCTGTVIIILLLKLVLLLGLTFSATKKQLFWLIFNAIFLGFFLGGIRVIILTLIVNNKPLFHYWHGSEGASIFSTIAVVIFAFIASNLLQNQPDNKKKKNQFDKYFTKIIE